MMGCVLSPHFCLLGIGHSVNVLACRGPSKSHQCLPGTCHGTQDRHTVLPCEHTWPESGCPRVWGCLCSTQTQHLSSLDPLGICSPFLRTDLGFGSRTRPLPL